jgi:L-iditol 2-dehydrogenase
MAANRARINLFGGLPADQGIVPIDTNRLHYKEIYLFGSHGAVPRQLQQCVDLLASGTIDMRKYITHHFPLEKIQDAFAAAEDRAGMRVVVEPGKS